MRRVPKAYEVGRSNLEFLEADLRRQRWAMSRWLFHVTHTGGGRLFLTCGHSVPESRPLRPGEGVTEEGEVRRLCFTCRERNVDVVPSSFMLPTVVSRPPPVRAPKVAVHYLDQSGTSACPVKRIKRTTTEPAQVTCVGCRRVLVKWGRLDAE